MPQTTVRKHPRKGTRGVKSHSRSLPDKINVPNRNQAREEALKIVNQVENKLGLVHLYMIDRLDFDKSISEKELNEILRVEDARDFIKRGVREGIFLYSSKGVKLAPTKEVKQVKWYLSNYFYSPYSEFKTELEDRQWQKMVGM